MAYLSGYKDERLPEEGFLLNLLSQTIIRYAQINSLNSTITGHVQCAMHCTTGYQDREKRVYEGKERFRQEGVLLTLHL